MIVYSLYLQKEMYMIAAGVIGGVFLICTVVMFLGVKERDGECVRVCVCARICACVCVFVHTLSQQVSVLLSLSLHTFHSNAICNLLVSTAALR